MSGFVSPKTDLMVSKRWNVYAKFMLEPSRPKLASKSAVIDS
jgi:hypothetical protein